MMTRRPLPICALIAAALVVLIGGALVLRSHRNALIGAAKVLPTPRVAIGLSRQPLSAESATKQASPPIAADSAPLPASLQGSDVDGWLGVDDHGHLVVTPGARWFFDYFLSATGEESPAQLRARIVAEIEKRLPPLGAQEAIALLDRYLAYRERTRAWAESGAPDDLQARLDELHEIRRQTLGDAAAAALFGEEESVQRLDFERRRVLADDSLSPDERQRKLDELEQQLPESVRAARATALAPLRLGQDEAALRAAGGSAEEIRALREDRFGREAADRLDALDREETEWRRRYDEYAAARRALDDDGTLTDAARTDAVERMLAERFTPEERLRVDALDQIRAASGRPR